jgi:hypothetical protein
MHPRSEPVGGRGGAGIGRPLAGADGSRLGVDVVHLDPDAFLDLFFVEVAVRARQSGAHSPSVVGIELLQIGADNCLGREQRVRVLERAHAERRGADADDRVEEVGPRFCHSDRAIRRVNQAERHRDAAEGFADVLQVRHPGFHVVRPGAIGLAGSALVEADYPEVGFERPLDRVEDGWMHGPVRGQKHGWARSPLLPVELDAVSCRCLGHLASLGARHSVTLALNRES